MHIYIVGGSGRTGQLVIEYALKRGHTVTALVRNPDSLQSRPGLTITKGTPLSQLDIDASFLQPRLPDAIIVTLNAPRTSDSPFAAPLPDTPPFMMATAHTHLTSAMRAHSIRKIVTMSAIGVGESSSNIICPLRALLRGTNMRFQFADHDTVDAEMKGRREWCDWVGVRPGILTEGEESEVRVWGDKGEGAPWIGKVTRRSVAAFLVDAAKGEEWIGRTPVITN